MLLIILLGAITKLAMISADCDIADISLINQPLSLQDRTKYTGTWYSLYYLSQEKGNENLGCVVTYSEIVNEHLRRIKTSMYVKSTQTRQEITGSVVVGNGYLDFSYTEPSGGTACLLGVLCINVSLFAKAWSVKTQDLSNGHDRYIIVKGCQGPPLVLIAFRTPNPDEATLNDVKRDLKQNGLDLNQFSKWETNHC